MYRLVIIVVSLILTLGAADARAAGPSDVIQEAVGLLTEGLDTRREELAADEEALYSFIDDILSPRFDRRFAASLVLGKHWRKADDEQKDRFIAAFYATLLHKYASKLLEFEMDRIEIMPYRGDATKMTTDVKTRVRLDDGTNILVYYTLVKRKDEWRMFDVTIEGVSYIFSFGTDFEQEIRQTSLESVIKRLENDAGFVAETGAADKATAVEVATVKAAANE